MADTISVGGKKVNKWLLYGGAGVVVVGGVLYLKRRSSGSSSTGTGSGQDQTATDPVTGLPYSMDNQVDPATGLTYLSEAQQYGSVSAAEASVGAGYGGVTGGGSGYSGAAYGSPTYTTTDTAVPGSTFATNAEWAQAVQAALPGVTGDTAADVASAIANYLAGLPLTSVQANDVQVAVAEFGPPPVGSFQIITQGSGSGPTGTGGGSSSGGTGGSSGSTTGRLTQPGGMHLAKNNGTSVQVAWSAVPGATSYVAQCKKGGPNGQDVNGPFTVSGSQHYANFGNLQKGTAYTALVWPGDSADPGGPGSSQPHAEFEFMTSK